MDMMMRVLLEIWQTMLQMAPYLLLGYLAAGLLSVFVNPDLVKRHLGGNGFWSILKASVLGVPLPLCSCGVIPVTASLRQQGAGRGASAAFLVATPTIGVDSFMATVGLLGPVMAVYRTAMSVVLGLFGGVMANWLGRDPDHWGAPQSQKPRAADEDACPHCAAARASEQEQAAQAARETEACCCSQATNQPDKARPAEECGCCADAGVERVSEGAAGGCGCGAGGASARVKALTLLVQALSYAFVQLPKSIARPLLLGIVAAGIISALVKADVLSQFLGNGAGTYLLMLVLGVPLYVCSTVAIPLALGFMALGASPGAAMIFMLVAPASNAATLGILVKMMGGRTTAVLIAALMTGALAGGLALDYLWTPLGLPGLAELTAAAGAQAAHAGHLAHTGGAGIVTIMLTVFFLLVQINAALEGRLLGLFRSRPRKGGGKEGSGCCGG